LRVDRQNRLNQAKQLLLQNRPPTFKQAITLLMLTIGVSERCAREYLTVLEAQGIFKKHPDGILEYPKREGGE